MIDYRAEVHLRFPTKKNPEIVIIAMVKGLNDHGVWLRLFKNRGINPAVTARRPMTSGEIKAYDACWNLRYFKYKSWEEFIEDEYLVTQDQAWCERIYNTAGSIPTTLEMLIGKAKLRLEKKNKS